MDGRPWSDLPADVLREISARVWASADFVYFHAVCKAWRDSRDAITTTQLLPWLLAPAPKDPSAHLKFWSVVSRTCYRATPASPVPWRDWECSADGTGVWYLTVENLRPSLHDPLTGEVTHLPLLPRHIGQLWEKDYYPRGIVYSSDGSTFLYSISRDADMVRFKAALLLKPGDAEWTVVERTFQALFKYSELYAAYHGGKIMVTVEANLWHVITPDGHIDDDVLVPKPMPCRSFWRASRQYNYLLESRGELLWALVHVETSIRYHGQSRRVDHKLSLSVHTLEQEEKTDSAAAPMQWAKKDGKSLADCVLFLGWPNSFAVAASRLGGNVGGCAYMAYSGAKYVPLDQVGVFKFNLISNEAEFIDRLPREWNDGRCTWIIPQPAAITPNQELTQTRLIDPEVKQRHTTQITSPTRMIHIERYYGPSFKALVRNMPPSLTSSQLRLFLSNHGKVSRAEVLYYKKTNHPQGIAELTMSTIHDNVEDAVDALSALVLYGYQLDVRLVKEKRRSTTTRAAQLDV